MDESYIKVKGKWHYLYRAIDSSGLTLDIWLRKKSDSHAAYAFFKRIVKQFGEPRVLVTDKAPSFSCAFKQLKSEGDFTSTNHRTSKYLNNIIEQDYRQSRKDINYFGPPLYKKSQKDGNLFGFSVCSALKQLMGISA